MTVQLDKADCCESGNTAVIFFDRSIRRAYKLFRVGPFTDGSSGSAISPEPARRSFAQEKKAYERAVTDPVTRTLVPEFFGAVEVSRVIDSRQSPLIDYSCGFLLECCLAMELVGGVARKCCLIPDASALAPILANFERIGLDVSDASVFNLAIPARLRIIDFK